MKVGWLADQPGYIGGAELTQAEFRQAVPEGVEIIDCPPGNVEAGLDRYIAHNVVHYTTDDLYRVGLAPTTWYHHDLSPHVNSAVRETLNKAKHIFCSPLQRDRYGLDGDCVPPALNLDAFRPNREKRRKGKREGICSIAQWRNPGKGAHQLVEWADKYGEVNVYGEGEFPPLGSTNVRLLGPLDQAAVPSVLWAHKTFVFLPFEVEPFCRSVVEAHFAGCEVITNNLIGAKHYIENDLDALATAAEDFWEVVLS